MLPSDGQERVGTLIYKVFEAQYLTCTYRCRTLHVYPYGDPRMTRGRCGLLDLQRMALSSTTLCRF